MAFGGFALQNSGKIAVANFKQTGRRKPWKSEILGKEKLNIVLSIIFFWNARLIKIKEIYIILLKNKWNFSSQKKKKFF